MGSRSIELVVTEDGRVVRSERTDTGYDPVNQGRALLEDVTYDHIVATGYGRNLFRIAFRATSVTEIKAYGVGVRALFPHARTVLDIGGQDSKAIGLNLAGRVKKFQMNDRCAAGTGKFLEIMAQALGFDLEDFGQEARRGQNHLTINSMCTVFAESEVTSLVAEGKDRRDIALALHSSVVRRAAAMLKRVSTEPDIVFAGGVAKNPCMQHLLSEALGAHILVPEDPQMVGALGASLLAAEGREENGGTDSL